MKYKIFRTSDIWHNHQPCEKAYQIGVNSFDEPLWVVDINSLDDILGIIKETGESIILDDSTIEIYDDYRE